MELLSPIIVYFKYPLSWKTQCALIIKNTSQFVLQDSKQGVFPTGAVDNNFLNTSSTSAKDSSHGTAIPLTRHRTVLVGLPGNDRVFEYTMAENKHHFQIEALPYNYTDVLPASFANMQHVIQVIDGNIDVGADVPIRQ